MITMMSAWSSSERRDGEQKEKRHYQGKQQESSGLVYLLHYVLPGMPSLLAKSHPVVGAEYPTVTLATCKPGLIPLYSATVNEWYEWVDATFGQDTAQVQVQLTDEKETASASRPLLITFILTLIRLPSAFGPSALDIKPLRALLRHQLHGKRRST